MIERQANPRKQGDAGVGVAIAWFATHGYTVAIPLTDSQPYDLVVDDGSLLQRVSVKTTTRGRPGSWAVGIRTQGGNKSQFTIRHFDSAAAELLFVVCGDGTLYLIPTASIDCRSEIALGASRSEFMVAS